MLRFAWGVGGVLLLLGSAAVRLLPVALDPWTTDGRLPLSVAIGYILSILFMAYTEGYRAFHRGFSPRVVARAQALKSEGGFLSGLFAPLFCLGFFGAPARRRLIAFMTVLGVTILIYYVRQLPQPYRGGIDAGVVVGLSMGIGSILYFVVRALRGAPLPVPAEVEWGASS